MAKQPSKLDAALAHAKRGWQVIPLHNPTVTCDHPSHKDPKAEPEPKGTCKARCSCSNPRCESVGKHPRVSDWKNKATSDVKIITAWWKSYPDANIGIATGKGSGFIVLDIDGPDGEATVEKMGADPTPTVITGKGRQMYQKHPGFNVKNKVAAFSELDSRGDGGMVVAPGSVHLSGNIYHWQDGKHPEDLPLAAAPAWWLDAVRDFGGKTTASHDPTSPILDGKRQATLASLAGSLRDKGLSVEEIAIALKGTNKRRCVPPLTDTEVEGIAASYGRYEAGNPDKKLKVNELAVKIMRQEAFRCAPIDDDGCGVTLMVYRNGSYKPCGASVARSMALHGLGNAARDAAINDAVKLIKEATKISEDMLNPQRRKLVNVTNGMLDWESGELVPHDAAHLSTIQIPVEWNPKAQSPLLDKFIEEVLPADSIPMVEEMLGYFTLPTTVFQKAFICTGSGANAKSTLLDMVRAFIGEDSISSQSLHDIEESPFAAAELQGKLLNVYHDLASTKLEKTAIFKSIVSGDPISAQHKYGQLFRLKPTSRLLFSANEIPRTTDTTGAFLRRWIIIPFPNKFEGAKCDPYMKYKLAQPDVLSALLVRAVSGLRRLMRQNGFSKCKSTDDQLMVYQKDNDSCFEFSQEMLKSASPDHRISKIDVWMAYESWCKNEGIKYPMAPRRFNASLEASLKCRATTARIKGMSVKVWSGLQWLNSPVVVREKF